MTNEKGLTVVELLATIVIFTIVGILVTSITVQSFANHHKIEQEMLLRDDAELLLAQTVKGIYTTLESTVKEVEDNIIHHEIAQAELSAQADMSTVQCTNGTCLVMTGFVQNGQNVHLYVKSVKMTLSSPSLQISVLSTLEKKTHSVDVQDEDGGETATYHITLGLYNAEMKDEEIYWFENEVTSINNL